MNEETLEMIGRVLDEAAVADAWQRGRTLTADEAVELAVGHLRETPVPEKPQY